MEKVEITLVTGREVTLGRLMQADVYAGLLEGTPDHKCNDGMIQWVLDEAREWRYTKGEPLLIEPARRDYYETPGDCQHVVERQSVRPPKMLHIPEFLPPVVCTGIFDCIISRDASEDGSSLTIVWFQDEFGIDLEAMEPIREVDWDRCATGWMY